MKNTKKKREPKKQAKPDDEWELRALEHQRVRDALAVAWDNVLRVAKSDDMGGLTSDICVCLMDIREQLRELRPFDDD